MKESLAVVPELFYDIIGVFLPGAALLTGLVVLEFPLNIITPNSVYSALVMVLIAYVLGHVLYSFSTIAVVKVFDRFGCTPKNDWLEPSQRASVSTGFRQLLIARICSRWGLDSASGLDKKAAYELCRNYVHVADKDRAAFIRKEQAYGEFARSMIVVCFLFLFAPWLPSCDLSGTPTLLTVSALAAAGLFCFGFKYAQCRSTDAIFVFMNFFVLDQQARAGLPSSKIGEP